MSETTILSNCFVLLVRATDKHINGTRYSPTKDEYPRIMGNISGTHKINPKRSPFSAYTVAAGQLQQNCVDVRTARSSVCSSQVAG